MPIGVVAARIPVFRQLARSEFTAMADAKHGTRPIVIEETPRVKFYCQCGWSGNLPYCDGSHSRMQTGLSPVRVELSEAAKKAVCQCHQTGNSPWCDGTHKKLAE
jgi:CDGSH-type Zn-finger protein